MDKNMNNIHYFQRFTQKENLATNNTMLLLKRLQEYSTYIYENVLKAIIGDNFNINTEWKTQVKKEKSVPDGQIRQNSYNILIETKMGRNFDEDQIENHISSFDGKCDFQIMLTLSPFPLSESQFESIERLVKRTHNVIHKHVTFQSLIEIIESELDQVRDYNFLEILEDFEDYCASSKLLDNKDNVLRIVNAGTSYEDNIRCNLYYDSADHSYLPHGYLGLYKDKSVSQIGKIKNIIEPEIENGKIKRIISKEKDNISDEDINNILEAAKSAKKYGYEVDTNTKFFIVERFYKTKFDKTSKGALYGKRKFFIDSLIGRKETDAEIIAKELIGKEWQ